MDGRGLSQPVHEVRFRHDVKVPMRDEIGRAHV